MFWKNNKTLIVVGAIILVALVGLGLLIYLGPVESTPTPSPTVIGPTTPSPSPTATEPISPLATPWPTPDPNRIKELQELGATEGPHENQNWVGIDSETRQIRFYAEGGVKHNMGAYNEGCNVLAYCINGVPQLDVNPEPLSWMRVEQVALESGDLITVTMDLYWDHEASGTTPAGLEQADFLTLESFIDWQLRLNQIAAYTTTIQVDVTATEPITGYIDTYTGSFLNVEPESYQLCVRLRHEIEWVVAGPSPMYGWFATNGDLADRGVDGYSCYGSVEVEGPPKIYLPMILVNTP